MYIRRIRAYKNTKKYYNVIILRRNKLKKKKKNHHLIPSFEVILDSRMKGTARKNLACNGARTEKIVDSKFGEGRREEGEFSSSARTKSKISVARGESDAAE